MGIQYAGIKRKSEFSPNHVSNDLQIINMTADALRREGVDVTLYEEESLTPHSVRERFIFSMVQGPDGTNTLKEIEEAGALIINSPRGVEHCYRINLVRLLPAHGIPFPKSVVVQTDRAVDGLQPATTTPKFWIKRGDVHAVHKEDVTLVYTQEERDTILKEFHSRGIRHAILQDHLLGDTVKFYGLQAPDFFHWYYLNGITHTPFNEARLNELARRSAEILGLEVFGGDAIIAEDGTITIIDINDWPSFAPVREAASSAIAQLLIRKATEYAH